MNFAQEDIMAPVEFCFKKNIRYPVIKFSNDTGGDTTKGEKRIAKTKRRKG